MILSRPLIVLAWLLTGCPVWGGTLVIPGTGDGQEMLRDAASVFSTLHRGTTVAIPPSIGSTAGKLAVMEGRAVLGRAAVPLTAAEEANGLHAVPVVRVPTAFFAHPAALATDLSGDQIADIFAGAIKNWNQVGGADMRIKVIRREEADSTSQVLRSTMPRWKDLRITSFSKLTTTTQDALDAVRSIAGAVSYGPYSSSIEHEVRVIRIDRLHPTSRGYPTFTTIRLIYKGDKLDPMAAAFLHFVRSEEASRIFMRYGGIPESVAN